MRGNMVDLQSQPILGVIFDGLVKSRITDGFVKMPRSRLANPEE